VTYLNRYPDIAAVYGVIKYYSATLTHWGVPIA
jgi:hypothetical protein